MAEQRRKKAVSTRVATRKKKSNKLGIFVTVVASLAIVVAISFQNNKLEQKLEKLKLEEENYQELLDKEQDRTAELEEKAKYVKTKAYIEETAKKLGLVYPDEIIFKPKN
ncbi:MAG: septum formation initiator family protein [Lachnospiraceae bacterium]|nr:septum formation initiator family protein [Lachnospiraceae bacterium]